MRLRYSGVFAEMLSLEQLRELYDVDQLAVVRRGIGSPSFRCRRPPPRICSSALDHSSDLPLITALPRAWIAFGEPHGSTSG